MRMLGTNQSNTYLQRIRARATFDCSGEHRGKTYAHALTLALPVCTCGSVARINLVVTLTVCQLVVVNQQTQMNEKRTTIPKKVCRR